MTYTLLAYDRDQAALISERTFSDRAEALRARFEAERQHQNGRHNVEVVVLAARSRDDLLRTHSRYFCSLQELTERATA